MSQPPEPRVAIIVLNWNGLNDTLDCLASLSSINYPALEIVVVDNHSSDDSVAQIRARYPQVSLLVNEQNLGYAGGNNRGVEQALAQGADYVLLLNNDTTVDPQLINRFLDAAHQYPQTGLFGAKIYYADWPEKLWFCGAKWDVQQLKFDHLGEGQTDDLALYGTIAPTDFAIGCALFVRRQVVEQIGLMDESFFLTYEETDWCYRARAAGFDIHTVPEAKVWHKVSASFGGSQSPLLHYFYMRNRLLWSHRHLNRFDHLRMLWLSIKHFFPWPDFSSATSNPLKKIYWGGKNLHKVWKTPLHRAERIGLRDYIRGRFGDCPESVRQLQVESAHE